MNKELQTQTIEQVFENYKLIKERLRDKTPQCFEFIKTNLDEGNILSTLYISLKMKRLELDVRIRFIFFSTYVEVEIICPGKERYDFSHFSFKEDYSEDEKDIVDFISRLYEEINKYFFEKMKTFLDWIDAEKNSDIKDLIEEIRHNCGYDLLISNIHYELNLLGKKMQHEQIETILKDEIYKEYQKNL